MCFLPNLLKPFIRFDLFVIRCTTILFLFVTFSNFVSGKLYWISNFLFFILFSHEIYLRKCSAQKKRSTNLKNIHVVGEDKLFWWLFRWLVCGLGVKRVLILTSCNKLPASLLQRQQSSHLFPQGTCCKLPVALLQRQRSSHLFPQGTWNKLFAAGLQRQKSTHLFPQGNCNNLLTALLQRQQLASEFAISYRYLCCWTKSRPIFFTRAEK